MCRVHDTARALIASRRSRRGGADTGSGKRKKGKVSHFLNVTEPCPGSTDAHRRGGSYPTWWSWVDLTHPPGTSLDLSVHPLHHHLTNSPRSPSTIATATSHTSQAEAASERREVREATGQAEGTGSRGTGALPHSRSPSVRLWYL